MITSNEARPALLGHSRDRRIQISHLAHIVYGHRDLQRIKTFLIDFGFVIAHESDERIYFRGYGTEPYLYVAKKTPEPRFLGGAWTLKSRQDLERVARLSGASAITPLEGPGGGYQVLIHDPFEAYPFRFVYGQNMRKADVYRDPLAFNYEEQKPRANVFQRFQPGPAPIHKLGHYGCGVRNFQRLYDWLVDTFNFKASDILVDDQGKEVGGFLRVNLGNDFSDHHSVFLAETSKAEIHHCSFEIHDFDTQQISHQYLKSRGYELAWGVGRHILGSQIFDYWYDPESHFMIEHYCDGDILNDEKPTGRVPARDETLAVWGPALPETFLPPPPKDRSLTTSTLVH